MPSKYRADELVVFASTLLERAGLARDRARTMADVIVEADLLGHDTHGLDQLAGYLVQIDDGLLATSGEPTVVSDLGAALTWDGHRLPGHWLVKQAIAEARHRILAHPVVTIAIGHGHHIGCLQAYLKPVTDAGLIIVLMSSDPAAAGVTPHGGVASRITPNPIAAGFPTGGDPILIDISSSTSTNAMNKRLAAKGERLKGAWLVDADGRPTDDPRVLTAERPGAMLPLGGIELGHKGFSLALIVEALTSGLSGRGRSERPSGWTASVFVQVIDPDAFGGREAFVREMQFVADLCHTTPVAPGNPPVRLPGEAALARRRRQIREGVSLHETIMPALQPWAERFGVPLPNSLAELESHN
ncbi:MAG TPA: Ldh family oxidoreductase [Vicinamibacterales bacterium]|nr:Ldh family oxidoreductase [Vicinamibacterales bacterium]